MKNIKLFFTFMILVFFSSGSVFLSCEEDEDEIEQKISGDSSLRVVNNTSVDASIYFDDDFIGIVKEDNQRTWSVPIGAHEICADCGSKGRLKESYNFAKGDLVIMTIYYKYSKSIDFYEK
jgi:hypothetical protein